MTANAGQHAVEDKWLVSESVMLPGRCVMRLPAVYPDGAVPWASTRPTKLRGPDSRRSGSRLVPAA